MIGIACYFGGEVLHGPNGAYYSTQPQKMFNIGSGLDFIGITREVYQQVGIDPNYYELIISARINIGQGNQTWFQQLHVLDDSSWGLYTQMTLNLTTPFKFLELYVVANPRQNHTQNPRQNRTQNPSRGMDQSVTGPTRALNLAGTSRSPSTGAGRSRSPSVGVGSSRGRSRVPSSSSSRNRSETPEPRYYTDNTDEDPEEREAEENWDASDDGGQTIDHSDEEDNRPVLGMRKWPISGRGERHPFPAFHDTSGFEEADHIFFAGSEVRF